MPYKLNPITGKLDYYEAGSNQNLDSVLSTGNSANFNSIQDLSYIDFNSTATITPSEGNLTWDDNFGTLSVGLKGNNVKLQIGQQEFARVVNKTVPNIDLLRTDYQVCVVSGATGQRLSIRLAQADNDANSAGTLGIVAENIDKNQEGFICTAGSLENINTTGSLQGETWADGDILYLSPTIAGAITKVKPSAPQHLVVVGYVEYAHNSKGKIYVKIDNGYELDELHNVSITSTPADNQVLTYDNATSVWKPKTWNPNVQSVTSSATVTPVNTNNLVVITAQAAALTLANPTGTWVQGQSLMIRIKDDGTARTITFDTNYRAIGVTLPTTTVINKTTYIGIIYNSTDTKWDIIGVTTQA